MSEAPKSIWVWEHTDPETGKPFGYGEWYTEDVGLDGDETEYVRCDELDRLRAENERLWDMLNWAYDTLREINISNYDHGDVCSLNAASVKVILGISAALAKETGE